MQINLIPGHLKALRYWICLFPNHLFLIYLKRLTISPFLGFSCSLHWRWPEQQPVWRLFNVTCSTDCTTDSHSLLKWWLCSSLLLLFFAYTKFLFCIKKKPIRAVPFVSINAFSYSLFHLKEVLFCSRIAQVFYHKVSIETCYT